ncbi:MAG: aminoacyl-histidine dipeptidase [Bacteroidales bacterium]
MTKALKDLKPEALWNIFEEICNIPHPSKKETAIIEYVKTFGEKLGLETIVDQVGNVIIKKPATPGMENRQGVILQGHLDMVPQKNNDTAHDFEKDPIQPYIDGEWVKAKGTTLGADNGIGVAAAMAVLQANDLEHGPLECLFTIDEETGMTGAGGLKPGILSGDILINMDSEDEGELYIGCAGGVDTNAFFTFKPESVPQGHVAYQLNIKGLKGGHSGLDIHLGRGNANKLINRILWKANREMDLQLSSIEGGSLRNAIPREAQAIVTLPGARAQEFEALVKEYEALMQKELGKADPGLVITLEKASLPNSIIEPVVARHLFSGVYGCPNGTMRMITEMPEVVETSTNLALIKSHEDVIEIATLQRSSVDSAKEDLSNMIRSVFELAKADVEHKGEYPGWKPNVDSPILKTMKQVYENKFGNIPEQKVIHAGLECGLLGGTYPNFDMISFGPTIRNPHSPDEMVKIPTVEMFWGFLLETLKNAPAK